MSQAEVGKERYWRKGSAVLRGKSMGIARMSNVVPICANAKFRPGHVCSHLKSGIRSDEPQLY